MGFFDNLRKAFSGGGNVPRQYPLSVKCRKCGEILTAHINLANDLSVEYKPDGTPESFTCRKIIQGSGRCFQAVEVILRFDSRRNLTEKEIHGGTFVEE
jgi:hypothetical protein